MYYKILKGEFLVKITFSKEKDSTIITFKGRCDISEYHEMFRIFQVLIRRAKDCRATKVEELNNNPNEIALQVTFASNEQFQKFYLAIPRR